MAGLGAAPAGRVGLGDTRPPLRQQVGPKIASVAGVVVPTPGITKRFRPLRAVFPALDFNRVSKGQKLHSFGAGCVLEDWVGHGLESGGGLASDALILQP